MAKDKIKIEVTKHELWILWVSTKMRRKTFVTDPESKKEHEKLENCLEDSLDNFEILTGQ